MLLFITDGKKNYLFSFRFSHFLPKWPSGLQTLTFANLSYVFLGRSNFSFLLEFYFMFMESPFSLQYMT